jgi:hypothetical protein
LDATYQLDEVNFLNGNKNTIMINTESLLHASKEVGIEVNEQILGKPLYLCLVTRMQDKTVT